MKYKLKLYLHYDGLDDDISVSSRSPRTHIVLPVLRMSQLLLIIKSVYIRYDCPSLERKLSTMQDC